MKNYRLKIFKQFANWRENKLCYKKLWKMIAKTSTSTFSSKYWLNLFIFSYLLNHKILYDSVFYFFIFIFIFFQYHNLIIIIFFLLFIKQMISMIWKQRTWFFFCTIKTKNKKRYKKRKKNNTKTVFTFFRNCLAFFFCFVSF